MFVIQIVTAMNVLELGLQHQHLFQASKTTTAFLHQVLERVRSTSHLKMEARIAVLERARVDLNRLGSIEPSLSDPSAFAEIYIHCQSLILKCLASKFVLIHSISSNN